MSADVIPLLIREAHVAAASAPVDPNHRCGRCMNPWTRRSALRCPNETKPRWQDYLAPAEDEGMWL